MKAQFKTALLAITLLSPLAAAGADGGWPPHFGFALGFVGSDRDCDYHGYNCDGNDTAFKVYGGKRLHENIAVEVSLYDLGRIADENGPVTTTAESTGINLSLHGIIPLEEFGYFYGKVGVMAWETDYRRIEGATATSSSDSGNDLTYGIGYAFAFNEKYELRFEFERLNDLDDRFTPGGSSITSFAIGGTFLFE